MHHDVLLCDFEPWTDDEVCRYFEAQPLPKYDDDPNREVKAKSDNHHTGHYNSLHP